MLPTPYSQKDKFPVQVDEINDLEMEQRKIFKRSIGNEVELTKRFTENRRNYSCQINIKFQNPSTYLKQILTIQDDVSKLYPQNIIAYAIINSTKRNDIRLDPSNKDALLMTYNFTEDAIITLTYDFTPKDMTTTEIKTITLYGNGKKYIVEESSCLKRANFGETVTSLPALICWLFLSLIIVIIVFIIIIFKCCYQRSSTQKAEVYTHKRHEFSIKKYDILLEESEKSNYNHGSSFSKLKADIYSHEPALDIEHNIYETDVSTSRTIDEKLQNDFTKFNDVFFTILLNSIVKDLKKDDPPTIKEKLDQIVRQMRSEKENIRKIHQNRMDERLREVLGEIIQINKDNVLNLQLTQNAERKRIMNIVTEEHQMEVESNLNTLFENEMRHLAIQLRMKQDEAVEETKMKHHADMMNDIAVWEMSQIKSVIDLRGKPEEGEDIYKRYLQWQHKLHLFSENEKIHHKAALEYLLENRRNQSKKREGQNTDTDELLEKKTAYFETDITDYEGNGEISEEMSTKILSQFERNKEQILAEMEKDKEDQMRSLVEKLNEMKRKKLEDMKTEQDNEINNVIASHSGDDDVQGLLQDIGLLELKHCENFQEMNRKIDEENTDAILALFRDIETQTLGKIDKKIVEIISPLEREGFTKMDIDDILDSWKSQCCKIQNLQEKEREKQNSSLQKKLDKMASEKKAKSVEEEKDQNNLLNVQNDVMDEVMKMQKTLSDAERSKIIDQFTKNKFAIESNLTASRLLQERKVGELRAAKYGKMKKDSELRQRYDGLIKDIKEKASKKKGLEYMEGAVSRCIADFVKEKLDNSNKEDKLSLTDDECGKIRTEILEERANLVHKKEEELAALLNRIQILKAAMHIELKDDQEKIKELEIVFMDTIDDDQLVSGIMKKHKDDKEKLEEAVYLNKKLQEEQLRRNLMKKDPKSLLTGDSKSRPNSGIREVSQMSKQNLENEKLRNDLKSESEVKQFEMELVKNLVKSGNCERSEILALLMNKFPLKTIQEIETVMEEIFPKSEVKAQKLQPRKSLIVSFKKINDNDRSSYSRQLSDDKQSSSALSRKSSEQLFEQEEDFVKQQSSPEEQKERKPKKKKKAKIRNPEEDTF